MEEDKLYKLSTKIYYLDEYSKLIFFNFLFEYILVVDLEKDEVVRAIPEEGGEVTIERSTSKEYSTKRITRDEFNKQFQIEEMYGTN